MALKKQDVFCYNFLEIQEIENMTITNKLEDGYNTYKHEYKDDPELLFVSLHTYELISKSPDFEKRISTKFRECKRIQVARMFDEFKFYRHEDLEKALSILKATPQDLVLIRKFVESESPQVEYGFARQISKPIPKHLYISKEIIDAYKRSFVNKELEF